MPSSASLPLRVLPIHAFLGDHQSQESITLASVHSTSGSKNVWLDEYGTVGPIGGWRKLNTSEVTGSMGADGPLALVGLYPYGVYQQIDGKLEVLDAIIGVFFGRANVHDVRGDLINTPYIELRRSQDGGVTWEILTPPPTVPSPDAPNGFFDILNDGVVHFAQLGELLVITGVDRDPLSFSTDGVLNLLNTTITLTAPAVAPAGAGNLNGNYKWRVIDVLSDGTRAPRREVTATYNFVNESATITWAASVSPLIQSYEIYRTTGNDTVFFWVGTQPDGTLTHTDDLTDIDAASNRVLQEHGDPPPFAALCFVHQQRMFYGRCYDVNGDPTFPRKWFFSDPGRPDSVYQDKSFFDASDGDSIGDIATGGIGDYDGSAIFFNERSIWRLTGTGVYIGAIIDYDFKRTKARAGSVSSRSAIRVPEGSRWVNQTADIETTDKEVIAYFSNRRDIRFFDGDSDTIISYPVEKTLRRVTWTARHKICAVMDDDRQHITWFLPVDGSSICNWAVTWNYRHGVWYEWPDWKFACGCNIASRTQPVALIAGEPDLTVGGFAYVLWERTRKPDGTKPDAQWMSKTIYTPARTGEMETAAENFSTDKRFRWADWLFKVTGIIDLEVAWFDYEEHPNALPVATETIASPFAFLVTADGDRITTSDGDQIKIVHCTEGVIRRTHLMDDDGRYMYGRGIRLRIREAP